MYSASEARGDLEEGIKMVISSNGNLDPSAENEEEEEEERDHREDGRFFEDADKIFFNRFKELFWAKKSFSLFYRGLALAGQQSGSK